MNLNEYSISQLQEEIDNRKADRKANGGFDKENEKVKEATKTALNLGVSPEKIEEFLQGVDLENADNSVEVEVEIKKALEQGSQSQNALTRDQVKGMTTAQIMGQIEEANRAMSED